MAGRQAKTIDAEVLRRARLRCERSRTPERDLVMLLLSERAGLRACEIAGLDWGMVLDARGGVGRSIELADAVSKYGSGRRIPISVDLQDALENLQPRPVDPRSPIIVSLRSGRFRSNSVLNWFAELYRAVGAHGCSSHSGRRTFITNAARRAHRAGATLRDVQLLAGHRSIETTQGYIDGDSDAQRRLIRDLI